jgi:hypothetical protein
MLLGASVQLQGLHGGEGYRDLCYLKLFALVPWRYGLSLPLFAFRFPLSAFRLKFFEQQHAASSNPHPRGRGRRSARGSTA